MLRSFPETDSIHPYRSSRGPGDEPRLRLDGTERHDVQGKSGRVKETLGYSTHGSKRLGLDQVLTKRLEVIPVRDLDTQIDILRTATCAHLMSICEDEIPRHGAHHDEPD